MQILETLPLGAKKQLLLVGCDGERFLVGTGAEGVQTIVRLGRIAAEETTVGMGECE
jgi:flagellar biogenesis protein FliO